jgi:hypothetical protein
MIFPGDAGHHPRTGNTVAVPEHRDRIADRRLERD